MAPNKDIFTYRELTKEEFAITSQCYEGPLSDGYRIGPKGYYFPKEYMDLAADIYNMPLRPDDIFVASYQRSGTTWTQELVWLLATDLDYERAASELLIHRYPFLEMAMFFNELSNQKAMKYSPNIEETRRVFNSMSTPATEVLATLPSPRFVKTHVPMSFLPPNLLDTAKMVYVARDPRDVIVSAYHHTKLFTVHGFIGDFKKLWNAFRNDLFMLTPYFEHVKEAWALRNHPNMLFLFYEDISKDLPSSIRRVAKFLGKDLTQAQMDRLCDHLSFENFKNNKSVNNEDMREIGLLHKNETFIRKGKSGGWREYFDEEMTHQLETWIADNLRNTDLRFPSMANN